MARNAKGRRLRFGDTLYHSLLEAMLYQHWAERLQRCLELAGSVSCWAREEVQETPHHPFYYLHDFSGKTSHSQNSCRRSEKGAKRLSSLHLTERPTNKFPFFGRNRVFLASLPTVGAKQTIGSSALRSSGRRGACNMEVHLSELSKKNHPSGRF